MRRRRRWLAGQDARCSHAARDVACLRKRRRSLCSALLPGQQRQSKSSAASSPVGDVACVIGCERPRTFAVQRYVAVAAPRVARLRSFASLPRARPAKLSIVFVHAPPAPTRGGLNDNDNDNDNDFGCGPPGRGSPRPATDRPWHNEATPYLLTGCAGGRAAPELGPSQLGQGIAATTAWLRQAHAARQPDPGLRCAPALSRPPGGGRSPATPGPGRADPPGRRQPLAAVALQPRSEDQPCHEIVGTATATPAAAVAHRKQNQDVQRRSDRAPSCARATARRRASGNAPNAKRSPNASGINAKRYP